MKLAPKILLDEIAIQIANGFISSFDEQFSLEPESLAQKSYLYADAMIKERKKWIKDNRK